MGDLAELERHEEEMAASDPVVVPKPPLPDPLAVGDYSPFEHHVMPNGWEVWYRDSDHRYYDDVEEVTRGRGENKRVVSWKGIASAELFSPSTISKYADSDVDPLMHYAARIERNGVAEAVAETIRNTPLEELPDALAWCEDERAVQQLLRDTERTWKAHRDKRGEAGTDAHQVLEDALRGKPTPTEGLDDNDRGNVIAIDRFLADHPGIEVISLECVVYSKAHRYAGRFDALLRMPNGEVWLLDLKTSKHIGRGYHAQMAGYDLALRECGYPAPDRHIILQIGWDTLRDERWGGFKSIERPGHYIPWEGHGTHEQFLRALDLHNLGREQDEKIKADKALVAA